MLENPYSDDYLSRHSIYHAFYCQLKGVNKYCLASSFCDITRWWVVPIYEDTFGDAYKEAIRILEYKELLKFDESKYTFLVGLLRVFIDKKTKNPIPYAFTGEKNNERNNI